MSGIFGILRFDGAAVTERELERLADAMAYRGPDGRDYVRAGAAGLGHCLMRVTKEDRFEAQPLIDSRSGLVLVGDCRLDNREELACALDLSGQDISETPDSNLILAAYRKWGEDCAEHLLGDFAYAIWDGSARKLILARDHMGQRGLACYRNAELFIFATDKSALFAHPETPQTPLDDATIGRLLIHDMSVRDNSPPNEGFGSLSAGSVLVVGADGAVLQRRYWTPQADPAHVGKDEAYYIEAYRRVLGEAVACRLRRLEAPAGLQFSGGYDSAGIAALAGATDLPGGRLIAATSVMPADYRGTIRHARRWVDLCKRDMPWLDVRYVTREGKSILTGLEKGFIERNGPVNAYHFVHEELLSTLANAGVRQMMDGHGGDYTLNPRGQAALAMHIAKGQWRRFLAELPGHRRLGGKSWWGLFRGDILGMLAPSWAIGLWRRARYGDRPVWRDQPINEAFAQELIAKGEINPDGLRIATRAQRHMREQLRHVLERIASALARASTWKLRATGSNSRGHSTTSVWSNWRWLFPKSSTSRMGAIAILPAWR